MTDGRFVGRRETLALIRRWVADGDHQPLIVTGAPGSGKTTLMRRLGEINRSGGAGFESQTFTYLHFCRATDDPSLNPFRFVENLSTALSRRFPGFLEDLLDQNPDVQINASQQVGSADGATVTNVAIQQLVLAERSARVAYDRAVRRPLERLRQRGNADPVRVVVDALDESLTFDEHRHLVELLQHALDTAAAPGEKLQFLLTTRHGDQRVTGRLRGLQVDLSTDVDRGDVAEFVGAEIGRRHSGLDEERRERLTADLVEASRGNFLYAYHAVEVFDPVSEATSLPDGLRGLYRRFLSRELRPQPRDATWTRQHWPVLSTLAVARGSGLDAAHLCGATGLSPAAVQQTLDACGPFLRSAGPQAPVTFYHPSFREFLVEDEDLAITVQRPHRRLAEFLTEEYRAAPDEPANRYAVEHLHTHLTRAITEESLATQRAALRHRLRLAVDDVGLLERKAALTGVDTVVADLTAAAGQDTSLAPQLAAVDRAATHLRRWAHADEPELFARQVLDAALQADAAGLAASARERLTERNAWYLSRRWDSHPESPGLVRRLVGHQWGVAAVVTLPGGRVATASYDETVRIWSPRDGATLKVIPMRPPEDTWNRYVPKALAVLADGRIAVGMTPRNHREGAFAVVDPDAGRIDHWAEGLGVTALVTSGSRLFGVVGDDVLEWDQERADQEPVKAYQGHHAVIRALAADSHGRVYSADEDGELHCWSHSEARSDLGAPVTALAARDGSLVAATEDGTIAVLAAGGRIERRWPAHDSAIHALLLMDGGLSREDPLVISASDDTTVRLWDPRTGKQVSTPLKHEGLVQSLADLGGGLIAAAESQDVVHIWNLGAIRPGTAARQTGMVSSLAVVNGGAFAGYEDGYARLRNLETGVLDGEFGGHDGEVTGVGESKGRLVTAGRDGTVRVFRRSSATAEKTFELGRGKIRNLVIAAKERVVVAGDEHAASVNLDSGEATTVLLGFPRFMP